MAANQETTKPFGGTLPISPPGAPAAVLGYLGQYAILGELGRGGVGVVYRALDTSLGRPVAIKMFLDARQAGPEEIARFQREAKSAARLRHPGIVQVFESGVHEGRPFIVLELVQGESFDALLKRGGLPPRRTAEIVMKLSRALAHAHAEGVIHRDVKPQNVLIDLQGEPRLTDFGLAREEESATDQLTQTGDVLGTPAYMAPEQAEGTPDAQGPGTDIYALGAVLYRALTGRTPFEAPNAQALFYKILTVEPLPLRTVSPGIHADLETIALRCLEKTPARRYASAGDVAEELRRFLDGEPIAARPTGRVERGRKWVRRNKALSSATAALVVALVATGTLALVERARSRAHQVAAAAALVEQKQAAFDNTPPTDSDTANFREATEGIIALSADLIEALVRQRDLMGADDVAATRALFEGYLKTAAALREGFALAMARTYCDRASALHLDPARVDREVAARKTAEHRFARHEEAVRFVETGRSVIAERLFSRILDDDPGDIPALRRRAELRITLGNNDGAISDYKRVLELTHGRAFSAFVGRSRAEMLKGDDLAAEADLNTAIQREPRGADAFYWRSGLRSHQNDHEGALADLAHALELATQRGTPEQRDAYAAAHAFMLWNLGRRDEGETAITALLDRDDLIADAWAIRGAMRAGKGDRAGAESDWRHFLELTPTGPDANTIRAELARLKSAPPAPGAGK